MPKHSLDHKPKLTRHSEEGSALIFGAFTFFLMISCIFMVLNVGTAVTKKIQIQNAADSAAMAGAEVMANNVSAIAWINNGMAAIYYNLMRYSVDLSVYATLATLKDGNGDVTYIAASDSDLGLSFDPVGRYEQAYDELVGDDEDGLFSEGEDFLLTLAKIERGIAYTTPLLVEKEVYHVASKNGAHRTAYFPRFAFAPEAGAEVLMEINDNRVGDFADWNIIGDYGLTFNAAQFADSNGLAHDENWDIAWTQDTSDGAESNSIRIESLHDVTGWGEDWIRITWTNSDGDTDTFLVNQSEAGQVINVGGSQDVTTNADGSFTVCQGGNCTTVMNTDDGLLVDDGSGFEPAPGENTADINGGTVNVNNHLVLPNGQGEVTPNHFTLDDVSIRYNTFRITLRINPPDSSYSFGWMRIWPDRVSGNGLATTNNSVNCEWSPLNIGGNWNDDDRRRHRMCQEDEVPDNYWEYEVKYEDSHLAYDSLERYTIRHALLTHYIDGYDGSETYDLDELRGMLPAWVYLADDDDGDSTTGWWDPKVGGWNDPHGYRKMADCWDINHPWCSQVEDDKIVMDLQDARGRDEWRGMRLDPDKRLLSRDSGAELGGLPLVIDESFFKFGITVATWNEHPTFFDFLGTFDAPDWGYFSIACARVGFYDNDEGRFRFRFDTPEERTEWVENAYENLYEPNWAATLYPVRLMLRNVDLDIDEEHEAFDSGTNYLFKILGETVYKASYTSNLFYDGYNLNNMRSPWNNNRLDISDVEINEHIHH